MVYSKQIAVKTTVTRQQLGETDETTLYDLFNKLPINFGGISSSVLTATTSRKREK